MPRCGLLREEWLWLRGRLLGEVRGGRGVESVGVTAAGSSSEWKPKECRSRSERNSWCPTRESEKVGEEAKLRE